VDGGDRHPAALCKERQGVSCKICKESDKEICIKRVGLWYVPGVVSFKSLEDEFAAAPKFVNDGFRTFVPRWYNTSVLLGCKDS
jgi:hypothetical protein